MLVLIASLSLFAAEAQPTATYERPEPPSTQAQREEDERNRITEGERSSDGATPDRMICEWRRLPGSNFRERVCQTASDRRRTRENTRETMTEAVRVYTDPAG